MLKTLYVKKFGRFYFRPLFCPRKIVRKFLQVIYFIYFSCSEQSIAQARASVMLYNNERKEWEHSGGSSGISRVHVYYHPVNNTYRIVGRKVQDHTVSNIVTGLDPRMSVVCILWSSRKDYSVILTRAVVGDQ